MEITLQAGETLLGTWALFYVPPGGGKFEGKLTVTNQRVFYDAKYDASPIGLLGDRAAGGYLEIDQTDIKVVEVEKEMFSKKVILTLSDGSTHVFENDAMSIDKTVEAINAR